MTQQGRADRSGPGGQKIEPRSQAINPGGVSQIGTSIGDHYEHGDTNYRGEAINAGRGYRAPAIGSKTHNKGSQGSY